VPADREAYLPDDNIPVAVQRASISFLLCRMLGREEETERQHAKERVEFY